MAVLASKSQYAPHQLPSFSSGLKSGGFMMNSSGLIASPTASEFSDGPGASDDIRSWDERRVGEWLRSINCHKYHNVFMENNITGDTLLECDQSVLKELGITKVGDRIKIVVGVKQLREQAYGNQKKRNRDTLAELDKLTASSFKASQQRNNTSQSTSTSTQNKRYSRQIVDYNNTGYGRPDSPTGSDAQRSGTARYAPGRGIVSPPLDGGKSNAYFANMPNSATTAGSSSRTPITPAHGAVPSPASVSSAGVARRHGSSPSLDNGIFNIDHVRKNCVKMIGSEGQTRIVTVSGCTSAQMVYKQALKKFGIDDDVNNYCVYITTDENVPRRLHDTELMQLVRDVARPERARMIFRKKASPPTAEEYKRALEIARDQQDQQAVSSNMTKTGKLGKFFGETLNTSDTPLSPIIPPPARTKRESSLMGRTQTKKITAFFGQRPPSELISSNLAEYFPGQAEGVLEQTIRNSIRRSTRMSRYQNNRMSRMSVATTRSYASSLSEVPPPVPSVADAWLHSDAKSLSTLAEETNKRSTYAPSERRSTYAPSIAPSITPSITFSELDPESPNVVVTDTDSIFPEGSVISVTDVESQASFLAPDYDDDDQTEGEDMEDEEVDFEEEGQGIQWIQGSLIGSGSFGSVYLALNALTGGLMAVKRVEMPSSTGTQEARKQSMLDALQHEITLLREMQHPNIVQYYDSTCEDNHLNIFLEYVPGGSVATMMKQYGPLQEPLIRKFVREILNGLSYLHGKDIIHRDIKGANVLVDNMGGIKISDFGISKKVDTGLLTNAAHRPSLQGSVFWMAPEVVKQTSYTLKADIWSLGCLVVEMFTGTHPYPDCTQLQAIFRIGSGSAAPTIPTKCSTEAQDFLAQTFELDHLKRPTADELLTHPFLNPMV
ncbi:Pkinase-domain-containing protein [Ascobolus immersus RN42]|uniref:mitogen-activated protein kinase n=1 Tax=Ascobolus immersus RN42 TaxID=1160509 RepID=A0A3N4IHW3_ASCIM|nr:Pkinase-domain-containing protein [Ascobolus immersus RN42]